MPCDVSRHLGKFQRDAVACADDVLQQPLRQALRSVQKSIGRGHQLIKVQSVRSAFWPDLSVGHCSLEALRMLP
jgi:hypothetical protein